MIEFSWGHILVVAVVALIVIGPKELPAVLRTAGQWMGKIRRMAAEFQGQFQEAMREAEMADLKQHFDEISTAAKELQHFDPVSSVKKQIEGAIAEPPTPEVEAPATATPPAPAISSPEAGSQTGPPGNHPVQEPEAAQEPISGQGAHDKAEGHLS